MATVILYQLLLLFCSCREKKAQREELKVHLILLTAWGFEKWTQQHFFFYSFQWLQILHNIKSMWIWFSFCFTAKRAHQFLVRILMCLADVDTCFASLLIDKMWELFWVCTYVFTQFSANLQQQKKFSHPDLQPGTQTLAPCSWQTCRHEFLYNSLVVKCHQSYAPYGVPVLWVTDRR